MADSHYADPRLVCQEVHKSVECFEREVVNCPGPDHALSAVRREFENMRSMCKVIKPDGSKADKKQEVCSHQDIMACVNPLHTVDMTDHAMACLALHNAVECVRREIDTCPQYLRSYIDKMNMQLEVPLRECDPYLKLPTTVASNSKPETSPNKAKATCVWSEIHNCVWPLDEILAYHAPVNVEDLCQQYDKSDSCLRREMEGCPNDASSHLWSVQIMMDKLGSHCQLHSETAPSAAPQRKGCLPTPLLEECLIHHSMSYDSDRKEPLSQKEMCLQVGHSEKCMRNNLGTRPSCDVNLEHRMTRQLVEQKTQCKALGYPIRNRAPSMTSIPRTILTLTVAASTSFILVLRHFL